MRNVLLAILTVLAAVFGLQNIHPISLTFVVWTYEIALAWVLLGAFVFGLVVGALLVLPARIRAAREARSAKRRVAELEHDARAQVAALAQPRAPNAKPAPRATAALED